MLTFKAARLSAFSGLMMFLVTWPASAIVNYSTNYKPSSATTLYAACLYGGYAIPGAQISLSNTYIANSNAHNHSSTSGHISSTYSPTSGTAATSGANAGNLQVLITATIIGQDEVTTMTCTLPSPYPTTPYNQTYYFTIGYGDIYYNDHSNMYKVGGTTIHGNETYNRYMTTVAATGLYNAVNDYLSFYPDTPSLILAANDQSLPYGGIFDLNANWVSPHVEHYRGVAGDIRGNDGQYSVPVSRQVDFKNFCTGEGADFAQIEFQTAGDNDVSVGDTRRHIHCRWPFIP